MGWQSLRVRASQEKPCEEEACTTHQVRLVLE